MDYDLYIKKVFSCGCLSDLADATGQKNVALCCLIVTRLYRIVFTLSAAHLLLSLKDC